MYSVWIITTITTHSVGSCACACTRFVLNLSPFENMPLNEKIHTRKVLSDFYFLFFLLLCCTHFLVDFYRNMRFSLKKRPNENSEQFKACFFRFLRFLLRDLVKRRHRSIVKERGSRAARQAAEKSSKVGAAFAAAAAANANATSRSSPGGDLFEAEERLRRKSEAPHPPAPATSSSGSGRPSAAAMPAAVRG